VNGAWRGTAARGRRWVGGVCRPGDGQRGAWRVLSLVGTATPTTETTAAPATASARPRASRTEEAKQVQCDRTSEWAGAGWARGSRRVH
jgi:hypothetical protein